MILIDTHAHLYGEEFDADRSAVIERARAASVQKMYLPGIDSSAIESMMKLEALYPQHCFAMAGLHPCYVKENWKEELDIVAEWLSKRKFAAVGEIGLDFYWDTSFKKEQYEVFNTQIEWALQYQLPIVIHTRKAMAETIEVVKDYQGQGLRGIFHCFGGSIDEAKTIIEAGFLLGIGGVVTYKNTSLPEILKEVPLENLVLETDAPYLTPVPFRGKRNESSYLKHILSKLVEIYQTDEETIAAITTANAERIFN